MCSLNESGLNKSYLMFILNKSCLKVVGLGEMDSRKIAAERLPLR